jgi:hypothetical protein
VGNEYSTKSGCVPFFITESIQSKNLFPSPMCSRSGESSEAPYDLSGDDEEYLMPKCVAETTPR